MGGPNVYTIAPHLSFVTALADGVLERWGDDPQNLAQVRVLLPTRRACRSLREAFLRRTDGQPMLLPQMTPLGDVDEDDMVLEGTGVHDALELPPTMNATARVVQLAQLVMAKDKDTTPEQAVRLAGELAKLIDQVHTEGLDLSRLPDLVHRDLAEHWQQTLNFLEILGTAWPQVLADYGLMDSAERRDKLIRARAKSWADTPPLGPVIAAGSTGTIPASAELLKTVAHLPQGFLVLPGLDQGASDDIWDALDPTHPQYGMSQLLGKLGLPRQDVKLWGQDTEASSRTQLLSQALAPAEATHLWQGGTDIDANALDGVERIDAPGPHEEAGAIALIMRQTLETAEKTCALITPDRSLARRVAVELGRWGVEVDDSAGTPLDQTPPGAFFNLVSEMAASQLQPVHVLACLKHPLAAAGMMPSQLRAAVRALELALLRGPRPAPGLQGLEDLLRVFLHDEQQGKRFQRHGLDQNLPRKAIQVLSETAGALTDALQSDTIAPAAPAALLELHTQTAARLAEVNFDTDERRLWAGEDGEALAAFIAEAHDALATFGDIRADQYPALLQAMMLGRPVRPRYAMHPRLSIWGPLEARLQTADVVVLGGLNEGSWPPNAEASPWMSRPMMQDFGLPLPERRIGLSAHDFVQALHAGEVYLTRSARSGGSPQVPSRWLVRLDTLLGADHAMARGDKWVHWTSQLTQPKGPAQPVKGPRPTPPVDARPNKISVTQVETWIRDPYAIYARKVLDLDVLDDIEADPGAADRGIVIHEILDRFIRAHMDELPDDPAQALIEMGENVFDEMVASPSVRAFWWPRFKRIAHWFADFETKRRQAGYKPILVEQRGELKLAELNREFTLIAKADRFDRDLSGGLVVMDYKTGQPPTTKQVEAGLTPQLPLEAAMAICGGFKDLNHAGSISQLTYVRLSGGRVAGEEKPIKVDADAQAHEAYESLIQMLHKYLDEKTPFLSRPRPMFESRFGDFDHLARVKEWSSSGGDA
ncbi:double-strand break repair protein AddB [Magnetovibrio sp. PR-2]|uniref:double-strand break repair protein AddB n=1 Tax=Magnetovibrio sp. PR-2 TaxID=3120356 RepID=UPI002FCE6358